jgi:hypothetical protein
MGPYKNIEEIIEALEAHERRGGYFFTPEIVRFFSSRIYRRYHPSGVIAGRYFITSEKWNAFAPRLYTVRRAEDDGAITTVGEFAAHRTPKQAVKAAYEAANAES